MTTQYTLQSPNRAEVQDILKEAHRLRSAYITGAIKTGLTRLRTLFGTTSHVGNATA